VGPIDVRFRYGSHGGRNSPSSSSAMDHHQRPSQRERGDAAAIYSGLPRSTSLDRLRAIDQQKQERLNERLDQAYALAGGDFRACSTDRISRDRQGRGRPREGIRGGSSNNVDGDSAEDPSRYLGLPVALAAAMRQGELQAKQLRAIRTQVNTSNHQN
jgi:hypothetical protein